MIIARVLVQLSGISEYEKARLQTIEANRAVLSALGLDAFKLSPTARKRSLSEAELAARMKAKQRRAAEAEKKRRQSTRLKGQSTKGRKSTREIRALRKEQERREKADELMRRRRRAHNKARSGGPKSAPPLTEAERAALESASGEWIGGMRRYLAARVSDANLRSVMRVVERLASGQGVDSGGLRTRTPTFRKGQPVSMATDFAALRAEANVWLRPEDDPGHGWRLDHPIGKLALYQAHLAARSSLAVEKKTHVKSEAEGRAKRGAPAADAHTDALAPVDAASDADASPCNGARRALEEAAAEGLELLTSSAASGYRGVYKTGSNTPYRAVVTEMPTRK